MAELLTIPKFFSNKNVLISGGTGFIGKVLIEKLLRSCPDVKNIYLVLRGKKGKSPQERIKYITDLPLFDVIKATNPDCTSKIKAIQGDCQELGLGLSSEDRQFLVDEINIVFHAAASVRFDDHLTDAVLLNTRGTREMCQLALEIKNLDVLVHISTTYCNTNHKVIEERLYPAHADWKKTIAIAENTDRQTVDAMTTKYIDPLPNTYCFTKSLSEHVVHDMCSGKIPTVIYRPSIVISSAYEPFPGWLDNFNGPMGLLIACGKGLVHSVYGDPDRVADYVPVDITVRAMLISAWRQAHLLEENRRLEVSFYNGSNCDVNPVTFSEIVNMSQSISPEIPFDGIIWNPLDCTITKCYYYHFIKVMLLQFLPAIFIDGLLMLVGKKPMLFKIQKKIFVVLNALQFFVVHEWEFINRECLNLQNLLQPSDIDQFHYKVDEVSKYEFYRNAAIGARKYLLKESDDLTEAKRHYRRMEILSMVCKIIACAFLLWLIFVKINILSMCVNKCNNFYTFLITPD